MVFFWDIWDHSKRSCIFGAGSRGSSPLGPCCCHGISVAEVASANAMFLFGLQPLGSVELAFNLCMPFLKCTDEARSQCQGISVPSTGLCRLPWLETQSMKPASQHCMAVASQHGLVPSDRGWQIRFGKGEDTNMEVCSSQPCSGFV